MAKPLANVSRVLVFRHTTREIQQYCYFRQGLPIGAILMKDKVADVIKIGDHGTTFGYEKSFLSLSF